MSSIDPVRTAALLYGLIVGTGVVLEATKRIVVFKDLPDLIVTFSIIVGVIIAGLGINQLTSEEPSLQGSCLVTLLAVGTSAVSWRAWTQNGSLFATVLAVLTKVPFAVGVPLLVIQAASPTGKTASERASKRASALLLLTILAPVMLLLVNEKDGVQRYLGGR